MVGHTKAIEYGGFDKLQWEDVEHNNALCIHMHLRVSLFTESKKRSVAAKLLAVASVDRPSRLANGDSFNDTSSI